MFEAKVGTFSAATSTGDQAVTGVGFEPQALMLVIIGDRTSAGSNAMMNFAIGITDGSTSRTVGSSIQGAYLHLYANRHDEDSLLRFQTSPSGSYDAAASFVSFDEDGFTINWSNAPHAAILVNYIAMAGLTGVDVDTLALNTSTGDQAITGVGFLADALFLMSANQNAAGIVGTATCGYGWTQKNAESTQQWHKHGYAQGGSGGNLYGSRVGWDPSQGGSGEMLYYLDTIGTADTDGPVESIDSDGFTLDVQDAGTTTRRHHWLALQGQPAVIGSASVPNSTGTQSVNLGMRPGLVILTWITGDVDAGGGGDGFLNLCMGAYDGTTQWGGCATDGWDYAYSFDNKARSEISTSEAIILVDPWGNTKYRAAITGFTDTGFDLNWTAVGTGVGRFGWVAFGPVEPDFIPQVWRYNTPVIRA
jgi:hypothetical protein